MRPRYRRLLKKAEEDFEAARVLEPIGLSSPTAFHVQQGLEKLFKVCIGVSGLRPPVTHNLVELWNIASQHVPLEINETFLELLNQFAVDIRYEVDATQHQAQLALEEALKIRAAVMQWLESNHLKEDNE
jgi:HEPN domain-containing protein